MQKQQCSLLLCPGKQVQMEERTNQINLTRHTKNLTRSIHYQLGMLQKNRTSRPVFSFRLNCFRDYNHSDKKKFVESRKISLGQKTMMDISCCKNVQSSIFKSVHQKSLYTSRTMPLFSPRQMKIQVCMIQEMEKTIIEDLGGQFSVNERHNKPHITCPPLRKIGFNQEHEPQKKCLAETQYSSKTSQARLREKEPDYPLKFSFNHQTQPKKTLSQKKFIQNDRISCLVENVHASNINPSFKDIMQSEPKKVFPNLNTLRTIVASNQHSQCIKEESVQQFDEQYDSMTGFGMESSRSFKRGGKNKKKTACFGYIQTSNTERSIDNPIKYQPFRQINQNPLNHHANQLKKCQEKAHFTLKSITQKSYLQNHSINNISKENSFKHHQRGISESSLHNIIESGQKEGISIQNSIQEIKLLSSGLTQQNGIKFKYVNTVKSIGAESALSEKSCIDVKFMQSIRQKKGIVKLV